MLRQSVAIAYFFAMGGEDFVAKHERTMSALDGRPDAGENEQPTATTALFFEWVEEK
jgi:hypothetical protein